MGWREIIRSPDPSRALYLALRANPTASRAADIYQGGFEGAMEGLGNIGRIATIPTRALAGAAANVGVPGAIPDVMDYALTGRGPSVQYGDILAGTLEESGEIAPGGLASKVLRLAGNVITDPSMAPALLTGAEAAGALAGGMTPMAAAPQPSFPQQPRSMPAPGYTRQTPSGAALAPPGRGMPGGGGRPRYPGGPVPLTPGPAPRPSQPGGPVRGGVVDVPQGPGPGPTATQAVPVQLRGTGAGPIGFDQAATQPVPRFSPAGHPGWTQPLNPTATQPVPFNPTATQRVPMTRGPGGRGQFRPKAQRKSRSKGKGKDKEE